MRLRAPIEADPRRRAFRPGGGAMHFSGPGAHRAPPVRPKFQWEPSAAGNRSRISGGM
jgi:hypothetical protein